MSTGPAAPPRPVLRFGALALGLAIATAGLVFFGSGGYPAGFAVTAAVLAAAAAGLTALLFRGPGRPLRGAALATAAALTAAGTLVVVDRSPPSLRSLRRAAATAAPAYARTVSTTGRGSPTCRPVCPTLTQVLRLPGRDPEAALVAVLGSLARAGTVPADAAAGVDSAASGRGVRVSRPAYVLTLRARVVPGPAGAETEVTLRFRGHR